MVLRDKRGFAAITGTLKGNSVPAAGSSKIVTITAAIGSASDVITLTEADHGITGIDGILGAVITGGLDIAFCFLQVSHSGLAITVASFEQDGTVATDFTGTTVEIAVLGSLA